MDMKFGDPHGFNEKIGEGGILIQCDYVKDSRKYIGPLRRQGRTVFPSLRTADIRTDSKTNRLKCLFNFSSVNR
jgi:hypothetical protein